MFNAIIRYFDLQSDYRTVGAAGHAGRSRKLPVLPQYLILSAGVLVEPYLRYYISTGVWQFTLPSLAGRLVFALVVGLLIVPAVYKSSFDPQKPLAIQLLALLPLGIGWQSVFSAVTTAAIGS